MQARRACPFYYQLDHLGTPQELTDFSGDNVRQRAIDGTDPITKRKSTRGNLSSQYKSWNLHMHTLNYDTASVVRKLPQFTGEDVNGYPIVRRHNKDVRRGYKPNKKDSKNPHLLESMHGSETKFSKGKNPTIFTSNPVDIK